MTLKYGTFKYIAIYKPFVEDGDLDTIIVLVCHNIMIENTEPAIQLMF